MIFIRKFDTTQEKSQAEPTMQYPSTNYVQETDVVAIEATGSTPPHDYSQDYTTFVALESGTFKLSGNSVDYSIDDGQTWTTLPSNTATPTITAGSKVLWRRTYGSGAVGRFSSTGQFEVEGNSMSLIFGDNFSGQTSLSGKTSAFTAVFSGCTGLTSAEHLVLPATTLSISCYYSMFNKCTSLTAAPALPATTLTPTCYDNMFGGCTSLMVAPELPATTLKDNCYEWMFQGCSVLNYVKMTATNITAFNCLNRWLWNVAASGTFVKATGVEIASGESGIPNGWTVQEV